MELSKDERKTIEQLSEEISKDLEAMRKEFLDKLVVMHDEKYAVLVDAFANSQMFAQDILMVCAMMDVPEPFLEQVRQMCTQFVSMWSMYASQLAGIEDMAQIEEMMEMSVRLKNNMRGVLERGSDGIEAALEANGEVRH